MLLPLICCPPRTGVSTDATESTTRSCRLLKNTSSYLKKKMVKLGEQWNGMGQKGIKMKCIWIEHLSKRIEWNMEWKTMECYKVE